VQPTLLYDGECRFCRFAARAIVRLDPRRALALLPFDDPRAVPLLEAIPPAERFSTWHLVRDDGRRASGGEGLRELVRLLPATRGIAGILRLLPLAWLYDVTSNHRGLLGKVVPEGAAPRRAR
jgi:predicted DCC family thiol-disulfide oxidoreductase YuxK